MMLRILKSSLTLTTGQSIEEEAPTLLLGVKKESQNGYLSKKARNITFKLLILIMVGLIISVPVLRLNKKF